MTQSASTASYDDDFFVWTQQQAAALRRTRSLANDIDFAHVAEEIEDLGKRDLREVCSFIRLMFEHMLKIDACPMSPSVPHWRSEILAFRRSALDAFTPGMRQLIVVADQWRKARKAVIEDLREMSVEPPATCPECPFELGDLVLDDFDLDDALCRIANVSTNDRDRETTPPPA